MTWTEFMQILAMILGVLVSLSILGTIIVGVSRTWGGDRETLAQHARQLSDHHRAIEEIGRTLNEMGKENAKAMHELNLNIVKLSETIKRFDNHQSGGG